MAGRIRGQERNEAGKLLAHPVSKAFEPEAFVLEAAGKDGGIHLAQELRRALSTGTSAQPHGDNCTGDSSVQLSAGKVSEDSL